MTMQKIIAEEKEMTLPKFSLSDARQLGVLAMNICAERELPVTISITHCGQIAFQCAMDGTSPDNDRIMILKRNVVELSHHSSLWYKEKMIVRGEKNGEEALALSALDYVFFGGSIPVCVDGVGMVGTFTVSGLKDIDDHNLAMEILKMFRDGK